MAAAAGADAAAASAPPSPPPPCAAAASSAPLLPPPCASSSGRHLCPRRRRLPARFVWALLASNFAQAVMLTLPFTLATYMVRDWLAADNATPPPTTMTTTTAPAPPNVDERRVGELTGLLTAVYSLSQACTSVPFGRWSDRRGRRPVLLLSAAASAASIALFGLAGGLVPAALARAAGGALNSFIGAWKTALAEATAGDESEQARVMALMGLAWGLGCVAGPAAGGLLARPCGGNSGGGGGSGGGAASSSGSHPLLAVLEPLGLCNSGNDSGGSSSSSHSGWALLSARPFALPCLLVAVVVAASGVLTWLWVPETLGLGEQGLMVAVEEEETEGRARGGGGGGGDEEAGAAATATAKAASDTSPLLSPPPPPERDALCVVVAGAADDAAPAAAKGPAAAVGGGCQQRRPASAAADAVATRESAAAAGRRRGGGRGRGSLELQPTPSFSKFKGNLPYSPGRQHDDQEEEDDDDRTQDDDGSGALLPSPPMTPPPPPPPPPPPAGLPQPPAPSTADWRRCPAVRHALVGYGLICLHFIALEELVPLWASSPVDTGGLARAPAQLALPLALNGAALVFFAAVAYPRLRARYGTVPVLKAGAFLGAWVAALMPLPSLLLPPAASEAGAPVPPAAADAADSAAVAAAAPPPQSPPLPAAALAAWLALMALKAAAQAAAFTGAMIRVNVVGRRAGSLGSINGVGQTLASLARGVGPAAAGLCWAAAVALRLAAAAAGDLSPLRPLTQFVPFLAVAGVAVAICAWYERREAAEDGEAGGAQ